MNNILTVENIMTAEENENFYQTIYGYGYKYGEIDDIGLSPTGLVHKLTLNDPVYLKSIELVKTNVAFLKNLVPYRAYINFFSPTDRPYFHVDGETQFERGTTVLLYATEFFDIQEGGETQFINNTGHIIGIFPKPASMVVFDAFIKHRATSYRTKPRFTVALKYETPFLSN